MLRIWTVTSENVGCPASRRGYAAVDDILLYAIACVFRYVQYFRSSRGASNVTETFYYHVFAFMGLHRVTCGCFPKLFYRVTFIARFVRLWVLTRSTKWGHFSKYFLRTFLRNAVTTHHVVYLLPSHSQLFSASKKWMFWTSVCVYPYTKNV